MEDNVDDKASKQHKFRKAGRKAEKKKAKGEGNHDADTKQKNPKAYAIQSVNKLAKTFHRAQDIKTKKHHIPVVDRTPQEPPPVVVAIVGPPKVGKTTLMSCIIRNYTRQRLTNIQGPVTVVSGKNRRLTLIECPNDISAMIDVAKVADLILLLVDAGFGFEMETFEFLNICQVHGMPKIMGVLTHLDIINNPKRVKRAKKTLKHRFWTEIYQGAKLFYLSKVVYGEYQKMEIHNLCRFISVMKFRPLTWRSTHPYVLVDRMEDLTNPEKLRGNPVSNREVSLYGFVRGMHMKSGSAVHIPGVGDYNLKDISFLPDPCPLPEKGEKKQRRTLDVKERIIYAPMSGVGGIVYDKDAVYIDIVGSKKAKVDEEETETPARSGPNAEILMSMTSSKLTIDSKMDNSQFSLLQGMKPMTSRETEGILSMPTEETVRDNDGRLRRRAVFPDENTNIAEDSDSDEDSDEEGSEEEEEKEIASDEGTDEEMDRSDGAIQSSGEAVEGLGRLKWKENLKAKAHDSFIQRQNTTVNLRKLVYGKVEEASDSEESSDDDEKVAGNLFTLKKNPKSKKRLKDGLDCSRLTLDAQEVGQHLEDGEFRESILDCFVTGDWDESNDAKALLDQDEQLYGDFEDLETGEKFDSSEKNTGEEEDAPLVKGDNDREERLKAKRLARKRKMKELFDREYDINQEDGKMTTASGSLFDSVKAELAEQARLNRAEFEDMDDAARVQYEGYRPGMYVRIELHNVPSEFVENFDSGYPLIVGGLLPTETHLGYIRVRVKRHRWYPKILKSRNPLILSMGWRRFQTLPLYYMEDHNFRQRMLKYTPQHMHCWAVMWGPFSPQGTGFLAIQAVANKNVPNFRITATGTVLEADKSTQLVKKLKLVGHPYKIFKNTCFVKGMFNSALEVSKFEGASIRTVSGIRGQVKRAVTDGPNLSGSSEPGAFRATFEDRILMSDIVFCRTWYPVPVPKFCVTCTNLLLRDKDNWNAMKTVGQLRHEREQKVPVNEDSLYKPIERAPKTFHPLSIPKKLQKELPFASRPKKQRERVLTKKEKMMKKAVILEPKDRKIAELMRALHALDEDKKQRVKQERKKKLEQHKKMLEKEEVKNRWRHKEVKRKAYATLGKMEKKKE